jgi:hypothetical protein
MSLQTAATRRPSHLRLVSANPLKGPEMPSTTTRRRTEPKTERTRVPGVYRRGDAYLYTYRVAGRQRWGRAATLDDARGGKRQAEADADRGELVDLPCVRFGDYARDWIEHYAGRTSRGFRESTRSMYRQMLNDRVIPYFDGVRRLRLAELRPRDVKAFVRWMVEQRDPRTGRLLSSRRSVSTSPCSARSSATLRKRASSATTRPRACASSCPRATAPAAGRRWRSAP